MDIFVVEGLDSTAVLQVLEQPFQALPSALFFVRSFSPNDRFTGKDHMLLSKIQDVSLSTMKVVRYLEFDQEGQGQVHYFVREFFAEQLCCNEKNHYQKQNNKHLGTNTMSQTSVTP